jgi:hypothetical protein
VSVREKAPPFRRVLSDLLISVCSLAVLVALLAAFDGRIREEVTTRMDGARASGEVAAATSQVRRYATSVIGVVKDQSEQHRPLAVMLVVGTLLTVVLFRM